MTSSQTNSLRYVSAEVFDQHYVQAGAAAGDGEAPAVAGNGEAWDQIRRELGYLFWWTNVDWLTPQ